MAIQNANLKLFDMARLRRNRCRAAGEYDSFAFLKEYVSNELVERVHDVTRQFDFALDWGSHDGRGASKLIKSKRVKQAICLDISPQFARNARNRGLSAISAPFDNVPFTQKSFDLFVSTLSLHWVNDIPKLLIDVNRSLKPDGFFVVALYGAGTLKEFRRSLIEAEIENTGGARNRLPPLPNLQDMATLLQQTGFALPVADTETVTVRYSSSSKLLSDIRGMGEQAPIFNVRENPTSRNLLKLTDQIYRKNHQEEDGKIPATFQIIWLSGWSPSPDQPKALRPGSAKHSLAEAVRRRDTQN